jgi:uncharacterized protein YutE (UPF0331/DUF86 family)
VPPEADRDVVLAKVSTIRKCVGTIREVRAGAHGALAPWLVQDVTVLNLERAAQACIDMANHLISVNGWELPRSARHAFEVLAAQGIVEPALARTMGSIAGFRNVAVHAYTDLDPRVVEAIAEKHLPDLEVFADKILETIR